MRSEIISNLYECSDKLSAYIGKYYADSDSRNCNDYSNLLCANAYLIRAIHKIEKEVRNGKE